VADIKIALRCARVGKSLDFIRRALAECKTLNVNELARAAAGGEENLISFLSESMYKDAVPAIEESLSAFERWYDNRIMDSMRPQKYVTFSVGPLVAYVLARENEIKTVGIILSGKANQLPEESIRGRVREMYV
jgi:V/A-type H+-transporting ATPase subunit C